LAGPDTEEIVGAVRSIVIVVVADEFEGGPVDVPVTEFAVNLGINVPSPQPEIAIVKDDPELELGENVHPFAVPALAKSAASNPVTD
jgi:hypothetical protein